MTGARAAAAAFAALIAAAGVWIGMQAAAIGEAGGYSPVGPRFFPVLVSVALVVVGLAVLLRALRGTADTLSEGRPSSGTSTVEDKPRRIALFWLSAAMLLGALLIERAGFVAAMTLAFWVASRAFAARLGESALRDAAVAVAVAVAVKLFFSQVLGLRLPVGPLGF